ncbi:MAG: PqqD family protein [Megasphaera micronuciformis]|nr:PqqD family protein [Megasphaera micronuciformis]
MIYDWIKDKRVRRKVLKMRENGDLMIVNSNSLDIYYLNATAKLILQLANGQMTVDNIKDSILEEFEIDEDTLREDLLVAIRDLQWKELLVLEA